MTEKTLGDTLASAFAAYNPQRQFQNPRKPTNEDHWRAKLANQGQLSTPKQSLGEKIEGTLGDVLGKALAPRDARRIARKAMAPLNDVTPVGNATGMDEGGRAVYQGLKKGDLKQAALGAAVFGLSAIPGAIGAGGRKASRNALADLVYDESGAIRAWHGSPHDFDKFEWSPRTRGTGEGAQAYGDGLYFAEEKAVADEYRRQLSDGTLRQSDGHILDPYNIEDRHEATAAQFLIDNGGKPDAAKKAISEYYAGANQQRQLHRALDSLVASGVRKGDSGRLYEVNINAEPEDFLDWDAPLSGQGATAAQKYHDWLQQDKLRMHKEMGPRSPWGNEAEVTAGFKPYTSVERMFQSAGPRASELFRAEGIPGIRFLDQGSRGAGQGTRNYVVFDDTLLDILGKY